MAGLERRSVARTGLAGTGQEMNGRILRCLIGKAGADWRGLATLDMHVTGMEATGRKKRPDRLGTARTGKSRQRIA